MGRWRRLAGVAGLPQASNINGCDSPGTVSDPAHTAGNPSQCRTFDDRVEVYQRLSEALRDAGRSALGTPSSVETMKLPLASPRCSRLFLGGAHDRLPLPRDRGGLRRAASGRDLACGRHRRLRSGWPVLFPPYRGSDLPSPSSRARPPPGQFQPAQACSPPQSRTSGLGHWIFHELYTGSSLHIVDTDAVLLLKDH